MRGKQQTAVALVEADRRQGGRVTVNALSVSFLAAVAVAQSPLIWFKFAEFVSASSLCGLRVHSHLQQQKLHSSVHPLARSPYMGQLEIANGGMGNSFRKSIMRSSWRSWERADDEPRFVSSGGRGKMHNLVVDAGKFTDWS